MVLAAAVSSGIVTAMQAWPEFFDAQPDSGAFPSAGSDMSGFTLEKASPESFAADMAALVRSSSQVTLREPGPDAPGHQYVPDAEWT